MPLQREDHLMLLLRRSAADHRMIQDGLFQMRITVQRGSIDTMLRPAHPGLPRQRADRLGVIARDDLDVHFVLLKEADAVRGVFAQRVADDDRC